MGYEKATTCSSPPTAGSGNDAPNAPQPPLSAGPVGTGTTQIGILTAGNVNSSYRNHTNILQIPLKNGENLDLAWEQIPYLNSSSRQRMLSNDYLPGGRGGFLTFIPYLGRYLPPYDFYWRVGVGQKSTFATLPYMGVGGGDFDVDTPQPMKAWEYTISGSTTTIFRQQDMRTGAYFEFYTYPHVVWGHPRYRIDRNGHKISYSQTKRSGGSTYIIRKMHCDDVQRDIMPVVPYFKYATESGRALPITKIYLQDKTGDDHRTVYFEYGPNIGYTRSCFMKKMVRPTGCVKQWELVDETGTIIDGHTKMRKEVDEEGYTTYFEWISNDPDDYPYRTLSKVVEPDAKVTYYDYDNINHITTVTQEDRPSHTYKYSFFGYYDVLQVERDQDALGNTTYYDYNTNNQVRRRIQPNGNTDYFEYSAAPTYGMTKPINAASDATTEYIYDANDPYAVHKFLGPRHVQGSFDVVTYYQYDDRRNRIAETDPLGNTKYAISSDRGLIRKRQDFRGNTTYYNFDGYSSIYYDSILNAAGDATYFKYNSYRAMLRQVSPRWKETGDYADFTTYYEYDKLDRPVLKIDPLKGVTYYEYTNRGKFDMEVNPRFTATYYEYSGLNLMTKRTIGDVNNVELLDEEYGYDNYKNRIRTKDSRGNTTYFFYDALDQQKAIRDALGEHTYFYYDSVGNKTEVRDALLNTTYYFYGLQSRQKAFRNALANYTYFYYDLAGNQTEIRDARLNTTYFFYDVLDRQNTWRDALGNYTYYFYNAMSNQTAVRDAQLNTTYFFYDAMNRRKAVRNALNLHTYFTYDAVGNVIRTEELGGPFGKWGTAAWGRFPWGGGSAINQYRYDALNRLTAAVLSDTGNVYFKYDATSNLTATQDQLQNTTYYTYDGLNRLQNLIDPLGMAVYYKYDEVSNLTKRADQDLRTAYFAYTARNERERVDYSDGVSVYFAYDEVGNQSKMTDVSGTQYYAYDELNSLKKNNLGISAGTIYYTYDEVGNRTRLDYPSGVAAATYEYNDLNYLRKVTSPSNTGTYYAYDEVGNNTRVTLGNGVIGDMTYDATDRATAIKWHGATLPTYFEYGRQINGLVTKIHRAAEVVTTYFEYDAAKRLTREDAYRTNGATYYKYDYDYDQAGNRTKKWFNITNKTTYYEYATDNALIKNYNNDLSNATYYAYDLAGNCEKIIEDSGTAYFEYNATGLVTKMATPANTVEFEYDGNLQRYKIIKDGVTSYIIWDGLNPIELRNAGGGLIARYTNGYTPIDGIGSVVEIYRADDDEKFYLLKDDRGTTQVLLDSSKTEVARRYYNAFGQVLQSLGTWPDIVWPLGYQTNWLQLPNLPGGASMYLSPTRIYHAGIGRFLERDILGEKWFVNASIYDFSTVLKASDLYRVERMNLYTYVNNNPTQNVDPEGKRSEQEDSGFDMGAFIDKIEKLEDATKILEEFKKAIKQAGKLKDATKITDILKYADSLAPAKVHKLSDDLIATVLDVAQKEFGTGKAAAGFLKGALGGIFTNFASKQLEALIKGLNQFGTEGTDCFEYFKAASKADCEKMGKRIEGCWGELLDTGFWAMANNAKTAMEKLHKKCQEACS